MTRVHAFRRCGSSSESPCTFLVHLFLSVVHQTSPNYPWLWGEIRLNEIKPGSCVKWTFIPREFKLKPRVSLQRWKCRCQSSLTQRWRFRGVNLKVVRRTSVSGTRNFSFDTPRIPGWNITALFHFHHHAYDLLFSCLWGSHDKLLLHSTNYLCHKLISGGTFVKNKLMAK